MKWEALGKFSANTLLPFGYAQVMDVERCGRWSWQLTCATVSAHGPDTFKTASGAKRACERVARRRGVVC